MQALTKHLQRQGVTYVEHRSFALGIAWRLFATVVAFAVHALMPFVRIEPRLDLEATAAYLAQRNRWIETAKRTAHREARLDLAVLN